MTDKPGWILGQRRLQTDGSMQVALPLPLFEALQAAVEFPPPPSAPAGDPEFGSWLAGVDQAVWGLAGCSLYDLPDHDYWALYEAEATPTEAAESALDAAGFYRFGCGKRQGGE